MRAGYGRPLLYDSGMPDAPSHELRPAFADAPHMVHGSRLVAAWYTDPPGVIVQLLAASEGTLAMCEWLAGPGVDALHRRFQNDEQLIVVFDLRLMTGREAAARNALVEPAKKLKPRVKQAIMLPPEHASRVYISSLYAAAAMLSVFGYHIEMARSLDQVIAQYQLRAAR